ncbi:MAG: ribonuclease III [Lachnospiraceae bacterium]|jgi:ribonuclease-3|nr:ribonuclease III [Lachnospiraceae bacterium]
MDQKILFEELEAAIGYRFRDRAFLRQALTHSSYINEHHMQKTDCNERLEFLGDAVLEIVSSEYLYLRYPKDPEGRLTRMRASIVCESTLDFCARAFGLERYLILGHGEEVTGGRRRASLVSDALEALIGAVYLDGGFANAKEFICRFVLNDLEHKKLFFDSKTILQELIQKEDGGGHLSYELTGETGPDHDKQFQVRVLFHGREIGQGSGHTKKAAEQQAAYQAILRLRKEQGMDEICI